MINEGGESLGIKEEKDTFVVCNNIIKITTWCTTKHTSTKYNNNIIQDTFERAGTSTSRIIRGGGHLP